MSGLGKGEGLVAPSSGFHVFTLEIGAVLAFGRLNRLDHRMADRDLTLVDAVPANPRDRLKTGACLGGLIAQGHQVSLVLFLGRCAGLFKGLAPA